jgi:hypothetical protein
VAVVGDTREIVPKTKKRGKRGDSKHWPAQSVGLKVLGRDASGKQFWQDVRNEIHQAVTNHVCRQIAAPEIESGQD